MAKTRYIDFRDWYDYGLDVRVLPADFRNKEHRISEWVNHMLILTSSMLKFSGLPDSIPEKELLRQLQVNGYSCLFRASDGQLYAAHASLGGEPNPYYKPTLAIVSNPILGSYQLKIGEDCTIIRHDSYYQGLMPIMRKYATLLAEHELSIWMTDIMSRIQSFISASDSATRESAENMIRDLIDGKLSVVSESAFLDGIKTSPNTGAGQVSLITAQIEMEQYLKASFWNAVGVNANYNMKREAINSNESQLNDDALIPLPDDVLKNVREGLEEFNAMTGLQVTVELDGVWKDRQIIQDQQLEQDETQDQGGEPDESMQTTETDNP